MLSQKYYVYQQGIVYLGHNVCAIPKGVVWQSQTWFRVGTVFPYAYSYLLHIYVRVECS